ncbi:MAG: hypothetical protein IJK94_03120 [Bacteroidaceae bacterium]|nr:hypothetical protein [Bacteroidaceae bacterium]
MDLRSLKERLLHYTWDLAYGRYNEAILHKGFEGIELHVVFNPYDKKWFADPFILREDEWYLHLLVEEFDSDIKRGRIAHLIIDKVKDVIEDCKIILDLPTHLSFPAIYRKDGEIIVHPENFQSGKSYMYRYDQVSDVLVDPICICNDPISDAVIIFKDDHYEMYATKDPKPNGNILVLYDSNCFTGPYKETEQIIFEGNYARMAGAFITTDVGLIRPAQDCNGAYGRAVLFMKDRRVTSELRPNGIKYAGIHTFNVLNDTFVVDLKKYDFALLYYLKTKIKG